MLKCDPRVFARCPYKGSCVSLEEAVFTEGSDCEKFNQKVLNAPVTNGDKIRMMNDTELARLLSRFENLDDVLHYCRNKPECRQITENDGAVPEAECRKCLVQWLRAPAYEKAFADPEEKQKEEVSESDRILQLYGVLEGHCLLKLDTECNCPDVPDCTYCLAQHLVKQGVTLKGAEHGT